MNELDKRTIEKPIVEGLLGVHGAFESSLLIRVF